eukprot:CAMPEP_0185851888 /NCGR_PEP_ID=MMETSP1354-20130828/12208_1 /TAXON_ID=708628 /ORGANISM="Erythrolobus madagascarensis, Strain CCMP3276" /LENGTH=266 /DNA_ID=CAMNT_0028552991 /DNA_START=108 /DNA_END=908 /DNA_ORIENTATION=-
MSFIATFIIFSLRAYSAFNPAPPATHRPLHHTDHQAESATAAAAAAALVSSPHTNLALNRRTRQVAPRDAYLLSQHPASGAAAARSHSHLSSSADDSNSHAKESRVFNLSKTAEGFSCLFLSLWWFITAVVVSVFDRASEPPVDRAGAHTVVAFSWVLWILFLTSTCIAFLVKPYDDTFGGFIFESGGAEDETRNNYYTNFAPDELSTASEVSGDAALEHISSWDREMYTIRAAEESRARRIDHQTVAFAQPATQQQQLTAVLHID